MNKAYASLFSTMIVTEAEPDKVLALTDLTQLHEAGETGIKKSHWISYFPHRCDKAPNRNNVREERALGLTVSEEPQSSVAGKTRRSSWQQQYLVGTHGILLDQVT